MPYKYRILRKILRSAIVHDQGWVTEAVIRSQKQAVRKTLEVSRFDPNTTEKVASCI